LIQSEADSKRD